MEQMAKDFAITEDDHSGSIDQSNGTSTALIITEYKAKLCFLLDVTGSMDYAIEGVKEKIGDIVDDAYKKFPGINLQFGLVGYRDSGAPDQFPVVPFTDDVATFVGGVVPIKCDGGGDEAEDVLGGMDTVLQSMDWGDARVKILVHIGDAPHHGARFHDGSCGDNHGDKVDFPRPSKEILRDYANLHIDYYFGQVGDPPTTKVMAEIFRQEYNDRQSKKKDFTIMDLKDFTTEKLFDHIMDGISASVFSHIGRAGALPQ
jgi:hypothetical protein